MKKVEEEVEVGENACIKMEVHTVSTILFQ